VGTTTSPDLVVVGGGPAGLACAIRARSLNLNVAIVDMLGLGGQLLNLADLDDLPGHPGLVTGPDLAATLMEQAMDAGTTIHFGEVNEIKPDDDTWHVSGTGFDALTAGAAVVATGTRPLPLEVPGEAELMGRGVSDCAACDGPLYAGRPVLVVGGGAIAIYEAVHLGSIASQVTQLVPAEATLPRHVRERMVAGKPPITTLENIEVSSILGDDCVTGLRYIDANGTSSEISASAIFVAHERRPATEPVRALVEIDSDGHIAVDNQLRARPAGLFAAGDVRSGSARSILAALADGDLAATRALHHLTANP
jgi:thioredoxin reductase (NADPH)